MYGFGFIYRIDTGSWSSSRDLIDQLQFLDPYDVGIFVPQYGIYISSRNGIGSVLGLARDQIKV